MKRFLCFFFAFLTVFSLCVPTMAVNLDDLPALDMDNTSIEYDFERVFLKEYSVNDYFENPLKIQPELITMAEKGFNEYSYNLFNEELMLENSYIKKADVGYEVNEYFNSFYLNNFLVKHLKAVIKPNVTYTLCNNVISRNSDSAGSIVFRSSSAHLVALTDYTLGKHTVTFSLTQEEVDSLIGVWIYGTGSSALEQGKNKTVMQIMLLEGEYTVDNLPPFEPYKNHYGLYFYIYNPTRLNILKDSASNQITIMSNISKWGDMHQKYQLKLVDTYGEKNESETHTDALILKFALLNYDDFVTNKPMEKRGYDISEFELMHDDNINAKAYAVAQNFIYTKVNGYTTATIDKTETVRIEKENLEFSYYRAQDEGTIDNFHDLQSVVFCIPKEYSEKYGKLTNISAVWEECLTTPILIANNTDVVKSFADIKGQKPTSDFPYAFGYGYHIDRFSAGSGIVKYHGYFDYLYNSNINLVGNVVFGKGVLENYLLNDTVYNNLIDKLYFVHYSEKVFTDEVILTSEEWIEKLNEYRWSDEIFSNINSTYYDLNNPVVFDSVTMNNFEIFRRNKKWLTYGKNILDTDNSKPYTNLSEVDKKDLKLDKAVFAEEYLINENDVQNIFDMSDNLLNVNSDMYILHFTDTPYITHKAYVYSKELNKPICDALVVQATAIRNFDFIDLTYNKNGVITIIPVVGSPQNTIPDATGNGAYAEPDPYAKLLEFLEKILPVVLVLIVISIILRAYQIFKRPKIIIKEERKRKK